MSKSHRQDVPESRVERGDELGVGLPEAVVDEVAEGGAVVGEAHVLRRQVHPLVAVQLDRVLVRRPPENVYAIYWGTFTCDARKEARNVGKK